MTDWGCGHDHTEQIWDFGYFEDPELDPVPIPLLCFRHRKHEPCRPCLREETMTPEQIFKSINHLLNRLDHHDNYDFGFQPPDPHRDEEVGKYLLGRFNHDTGTMDVVQYIQYSDENQRYEIHEGDPGA